jgi:phosphotransferase system  glucose/maltose/N-acetylglucosamine-specific IIC component
MRPKAIWRWTRVLIIGLVAVLIVVGLALMIAAPIQKQGRVTGAPFDQRIAVAAWVVFADYGFMGALALLETGSQ